MIKYSIRRQMTAIFIGLFSLILGLVLIINNAFLGHYYLSHKADDLIRTYNDVNAKLESGRTLTLSWWTEVEMRSLRHLEKAIRV